MCITSSTLLVRRWLRWSTISREIMRRICEPFITRWWYSSKKGGGHLWSLTCLPPFSRMGIRLRKPWRKRLHGVEHRPGVGQQRRLGRPNLMEELLGALASCARFNGSWAWWNLEAPYRRSGWNFSWCGSHGNERKEACKEVDGEVDGESLEGDCANLQERELLAFKRRNSMWNLRQCAENLAAYHYSKSSLQERFLNFLFIEKEKS